MDMDFKGKKVLLLDGFGRQIASILIQLRRLGCVVTTMNASKLDIGYSSRYPKKKILVKGIREDSDIYREAIRKAISEEKYDIIFPVIERSTEIVHELNLNGELGDAKIVAAPKEAFEMAYDKQKTMTVCMENGIPCPITKLDSETLDEYLAKVEFPLACKPRHGSGGAGFKKVNSREELQKYVDDGVIKIEEYVIQEFVPQTEHMFGCYVMMNDDHEPMFTVVVETCRWFPIDGGPGCFIRTVDRPDIVEYAQKLFGKLNWSGFGHMSFLLDPRDNTPKVMEINGRIPAGIKICDYCGCNPIKYILERAYGEKSLPVEHKIPVGLSLRYFHTDILWFIKSPRRFKERPSWFSVRRCKDYIFSWGDPIPFFTYSIEHILTYKKDMAKRKH